jgi:hypothetical protein
MDDNKKFRNTKHCGGAVFKNGYKDNDKKPEWVNAEFEITGEFMKPLINEYKKKYANDSTTPEAERTVSFNLAMWERQSKNGNPYFYLKFEKQIEDESEEIIEQEVTNNDGFNDDDIPF